MILLPIFALVVGALVAMAFRVGAISGQYGTYYAVACLAGLDTVFGGIRSGLEGKFNSPVFYTGFISNTLIAFFLTWFGDRIYVPLVWAVTVVLGSRIFTNLSLIRRFGVTKWQDAVDRKKLKDRAQTISTAATEPNL